MNKKAIIFVLFLVISLTVNCTSKRIIIQNNDTCDKYLALKDSVVLMEGEEKAINLVRLDMLKASCGNSSNGIPVKESDRHFHIRPVEFK